MSPRDRLTVVHQRKMAMKVCDEKGFGGVKFGVVLSESFGSSVSEELTAVAAVFVVVAVVVEL